jgi:hypothetical protein
MIRTGFFLLLLLSACADKQSGRAFNVRSAAVYVPQVQQANTSVERNSELASALDRSLDQQETLDHEDQHLVSGAAVVAHPRVRHDEETEPVADQR